MIPINIVTNVSWARAVNLLKVGIGKVILPHYKSYVDAVNLHWELRNDVLWAVSDIREFESENDRDSKGVYNVTLI